MAKKNIDSRELINEMQSLLKTPKLTLENFIFSEDEHDFEPEEEEVEEPERFEVPQGTGVDVTDDIIKIRKLALDAIGKVADDPTGEQYQLLKKIWNMVDKAYEAKGKPADIEKEV